MNTTYHTFFTWLFLVACVYQPDVMADEQEVTYPIKIGIHSLWPYAGYDALKKEIEDRLEKTIEPHDVLVPVDIEGCELNPLLLYAFPRMLPLSLLDGKREGAVIPLTVINDRFEKMNIKLTCTTHNKKSSSFHKDVELGKQRFATDRPWIAFRNDREQLIKSGIVGARYDWRNNFELVVTGHGPKGFKLKQQEQPAQ